MPSSLVFNARYSLSRTLRLVPYFTPLIARTWNICKGCFGLKCTDVCRYAARSQRVLAATVVRQLMRMNERYCRRALAAWRSALQAQRDERAMLHRAIQRMAVAKLRAAWHAWAELVVMKLAVRREHSAVMNKVSSHTSQTSDILLLYAL